MTSKVLSKADLERGAESTWGRRAPNLTNWSLKIRTIPKNHQGSIDANKGEYLVEHYACLVGIHDVQQENVKKLRMFIQQGRDLGVLSLTNNLGIF